MFHRLCALFCSLLICRLTCAQKGTPAPPSADQHLQVILTQADIRDPDPEQIVRLRKCVGQKIENCKLLTDSSRDALEKDTVGRLGQAFAALIGACTKAQINDLVIQFNKHEDQRAKQELLASAFSAGISIFTPAFSAVVMKHLLDLPVHATINQYRLGLFYLKSHESLENVANKAHEQVTKSMTETLVYPVGALDFTSSRDFCEELENKYGSFVNKLRTRIFSMSDADLLGIWTEFDWEEKNSSYYRRLVENLFEDYRRQVLPISYYRTLGDPSGGKYDLPNNGEQTSIYWMRNEGQESFLALIFKYDRNRGLDQSTTYSSKMAISPFLVNVALRRAERMGLKVIDIETDLIKHCQIRTVYLQYFPQYFTDRVKSYCKRVLVGEDIPWF